MLWQILRRRRRINNKPGRNLRKSLRRSGFLLLVLFVLHSAAMIVFEDLSLGDATWLTVTTATTVGYGDVSAATLYGRLSTVVLLYFGGIFLLGSLAGDYFDYRNDIRLRKLRGAWNWEMENHIVVLNTPLHHGERYLRRFVKELRATEKLADRPVLLVTREYPDGLPDTLRRDDDLVHITGHPSNEEVLMMADVADACAVVILAKDDADKLSDALSFDLIHRLRDMGVKKRIIAECVDDANRERMLKAGASHCIRPIRAYPEMLVASLENPGVESIAEDLFSVQGSHYMRYDLPSEISAPWKDIVISLVNADLGTPVAYLDGHGEVQCNPNGSAAISSQCLFVVSRQNSQPQDVFASLKNFAKT